MKPAAPGLNALFIGTVSLLIFLCTVTLTYFTSKQYKKQTMAHLGHYTETVAHDLAYTATDYILTENFSSLQDVIVAYSDLDQLDTVTILDTYGMVIAASQIELLATSFPVALEKTNEGAITKFNFDTWRMQYLSPIQLAGTTIGWSRICLNTKQLKMDLATLQQKAIFVGIGVWLSACVVVVFLSLFINKSIKNIADVAGEIASGYFHKHAEIQGPKEIRQLAGAFNTMTDGIRTREKLLQVEKEWLAVTLRSIGDAVIATDIQGRVISLNRVAEELTGWSQEEAEGNPSTDVFNIINEKTGAKCSSPVHRVIKLGRIIGLANHTALIRKNGTILSIADSGSPIRNREGKIIGVVIVFRDISHEKRRENDLLKVAKLESLGVLAGGIAHDFNNILSAILGNIELTGYRLDKEDTRAISLLSGAEKACKRAAKLTDQLLTFAKGGKPVREETSLPKIISESCDFVLHGSKAMCEYNFPDKLWRVNVDSGQISQVIQNITINARHAMPEGGMVSIKGDNIKDAANEALLSIDEGDYVKISITDTGIGIPKEIINKIFDPYYSTKSEGSGLGLAICHSIINKHDGYLTVDSISGKGTTFTIYLPAIRLAENSDKTENTQARVIKSARIMVMDDEKMIREVAEAQLIILGHEPVLVTGGEQAINKYQEFQDSGTPVDLVIMDLTVPGGMGGREAAEKLLQIDPTAKLIVASGYSHDPVLADYKTYGFCAAITKPFDLQDMEKGISAALSTI